MNDNCCHTCPNCIYIGDGDSMCDETNQIVLIDWEPTEHYGCCEEY